MTPEYNALLDSVMVRGTGAGPNAETVVLLIHGFTGSPSEFRRLGYYLNDQGYTVKAILLPGHGTTPEDMIRTGFRDWWRCVKEAFEELREAGFQRVIPIGHSMGGLLSLKLAMEEEVPAVVSLATPIHLGSRKVIFAFLIQFFVKYISKRRLPDMRRSPASPWPMTGRLFRAWCISASCCFM